LLEGKDYAPPNVIVDFDLKILESNSFFRDFFDHKKDWKKLSVKITDLIEFDNPIEFKKSLNCIHSLKEANTSFHGKIKTGKKLAPIKVTISNIADANQKWSNQAVELTCQKIDKPSRSIKIHQQILEDSPVKIFSVDLDFNLTFFSISMSSFLEFLFGKPPKVGQPFVTKKFDKEEWENYFEIVFSDQKIFLEKSYQIDSIEFYDLFTFAPQKNDEGKVIGCIVYASDILELKKVERKHYRNHKKYQHLFENNFIGIGVLNIKGRLIKANDAFCKLVGIENRNLEELKSKDYFFEEDLILFKSKLDQIYKNEIANFTTEIKFRDVNHQIKFAQIGLNALYENDVFSGCLFSVLDISTQKEIEIKEQELNELKIQETINLNHQLLLQQELDSRIRELATNQMLIAQKNNLMKEFSKKLEKLTQQLNPNYKSEIRKIISSINRQNIFDDDWENLKIHFVKMHPSFFKKLTNKAPKITERDLRQCAYIKLGFSAKETSDLLGTLPTSIEQARFRIKKKLDLPVDQKLSDYLRSI